MGSRPPSRLRRACSAGMLGAGLVALLAATLTLYVRDRILDANHFADEVTASVDDPAVSRLLATRITNQVIERAAPNVVTVRPLVESAVGSLLGTAALRGAIRRGVATAHRAVFERNVNDAVLTVAHIGAAVRDALEQVDPELAQRIPKNLDVRVLDFGDQPALVRAARAADKVRRWAGVLPAIALALLAGSVLVAPRRRRATVLLGMALVGFALTLTVGMAATRLGVLHHVPAGGDRDAGSAVWREFFGDLTTWAIVIGGAGVLIATVAATFGRGGDLLDPVRRGWSRISRQPSEAASRTRWSIAMVLAGLLMILASGLVVRLAVVGAGIYLLARGGVALATSAAGRIGWKASRRGSGQEGGGEPPEAPLTRRGALIGAGVIVLVAGCVGLFLSLALRDDVSQTARAVAGPADRGCNGSSALCDRPLDDVAFFATHNSYAGSGYPGFLFAEQQGTIPDQLEGGVRGLWIDTYYGVPGRRVYTRTDLIDPALNAQLKEELGPKIEQAAANIRGRIAEPPSSAPTHIYLCHGYCELGAVDAGDAFRRIRDFLAANPREVLIIDLEDYTRPGDTVALIRQTGLAKYVYKGPTGPPWPTLGQMISSGGRILLVVEHQIQGAPSWYRPAYENVFQETPFAFPSAEAMNCRPNRGSPSNSLFLINNWISSDPTPLVSNAAIANNYDFLLGRARRCEARRNAFPNVLNVDFWKTGATGKVVRTLNTAGQG